jgi:restriction system protein
MPPWLALVFAAGSFFALRWVAGFDVAKPTDLSELGPLAYKQFAVAIAGFGQYVLPVIFVIGAVAGVFRRFRQAKMLDHFAGAPPKRGKVRYPRNAIPFEDVATAIHWTPTWNEFEGLVAEFFRRQGYSVRESEPGPDGGVDLDLRRDGERRLIQCKNWSRPVGVKVVRELKGVMAHEGVPHASIVASGEFTADAIDFARTAGITLIDGAALKALTKSLKDDDVHPPPTIEAPRDAEHERKTCPVCSAAMVLRTAKRGPNAGSKFFGCSRFPACRATLQVT